MLSFALLTQICLNSINLLIEGLGRANMAADSGNGCRRDRAPYILGAIDHFLTNWYILCQQTVKGPSINPPVEP